MNSVTPRHLLFAIIAYRIQADRFGDLDQETRQLLDRTGAKESGTAMSARLTELEHKGNDLSSRCIGRKSSLIQHLVPMATFHRDIRYI